MSSYFNPPCKFKDKQKVKIISGYHRGKVGTIKEVTYQRGGHDTYQMVDRKNPNEFTYIIKIGWISDLIVMESQLVALE